MSIRHAAGVLVAVSVVVAVVVAVVTEPAQAGGRPAYAPPVDAPVVDPFRPPASAYGPGNRGLTYDLAPGTIVRASAPGEVVFAGPVGTTLHVSVLHDDGLRTTYSFLERVDVRRNQVVEQGDPIGTAGHGFHFGVRDGDTYLDPASLFARVQVRVHLVPHAEPLPPTDAGLRREREVLVDVVEDQGALGRLADGALSVAGDALDLASDAFGRAEARLRLLADLDPLTAQLRALHDLVESLRAPCTPAGAAPPPAPATGHVAVLVAGHGSDSVSASIDDVDTAAAGYASGDVVRYSYQGGRIPRAGVAPDLAAVPATEYGHADTQGDLVDHGRRLADLVEAVSAARPDAPIDLLAHSQGGIVTRLALEELERRGALDRLGTVVTFGSPHGGTELGTGAAALGALDAAALQRLFDGFGAGLDADSVAVRQMAETSPIVDRLAREVPDGVALRTIAATGDLVVTADKSEVAGRAEARVSLLGPSAHAELPGAPASQRELQLALAGLPPGCRSLAERVFDATVPGAIAHLENALLGVVVHA